MQHDISLKQDPFDAEEACEEYRPAQLMKSELEPIQLPNEQYVVDPGSHAEEADPLELPPAPPAELPWRRPLDVRLRAVVRAGGILTFLMAALLAGLVRAYLSVGEAQSQMRTEARAMAASVAGTLSTGDWGSAFGVLSALAEKRHISGAALYDLKGKRFADYAVSNAVLRALPQPNAPHLGEPSFGVRAFPGSLVLWETVRNKGDAVGWLVLEADLGSYWRSFGAEMAWTSAAMFVAILLGAALVNRIQQRMTDPLFRLARTAKVIIEDGDYTLRAWKDAHDEAGGIAGAFNRLLEEIQQRDAALAAARSEAEEAHRMALDARNIAGPGDGESLRLRTQLLANMCHEIRTPMTRAISAAKQLALTQLDARQREFLAKTRDAAEYVLSFTNDMLDYIRIESGKLELQQTVFDPGEAARCVVHLYQERAQSRQIKLSAQLLESLPAQVKGDSARLRQVIGSLVGNAIKFSQGGEIALELSAGQRTGNRVQLLVKIKDSGIGIAEEARIRIYQTFTQADEKLGAPTGSASLGLSIARQLVRRMGGELLLDGTAEHSTGFRFTVDVEEAEGARPRDVAAPPAPAEKPREAESARKSLGQPFSVPSTTPGQWEQLIEVYLDSAQEFVEQLTRAIDREDVEHACAAARTLGGCSAKIGVPDLAALCRKVEETVQGGDFPGARSHLREIAMTYEQARLSLRRAVIAPDGSRPLNPRDSIPAVA